MDMRDDGSETRGRGSSHCAPHLVLRMPTRVCFRCMGRGVVLKADKTTRVNAGGSGTMAEPTTAAACTYAKCPRCGGRGWVFVDEDSPLCTGECDNCIFEEDCYSPAWEHG